MSIIDTVALSSPLLSPSGMDVSAVTPVGRFIPNRSHTVSSSSSLSSVAVNVNVFSVSPLLKVTLSGIK